MCERRRTEKPRIARPFLLLILLALYLAVCGAYAGNHDAKANVTVIQHIVFILKENHTLDNYFGTFPGANGVASGITSNRQVIPPSHMPGTYLVNNLCNGWDCAILATDGGRMDKFDIISGGGLSSYTQASG